MAKTFSHKIVSSKMDILVEHRDYLQTFVDETNKVLQLTTAWLRNEDTTKSFTSFDMKKMIEDKLAFLLSTEFSVGCEEPATEQEPGAARSSPSAPKSTDQSLSAGHVHVSGVTGASDELKTILSQVNVMQDSMSFLSTSSKMLSEKQLAMEKLVESLSDKYSKVEQEKLREIERELEDIKEKHKKAAIQRDKRMTSFEKKIQDVTDTQSDIIENCHQQQIKIKDQKKETEKLKTQSQQFTKDLRVVLENVQELNAEISVLEKKNATNTRMGALEGDIKSLRGLEELSTRFEEHGSELEELSTRCEEHGSSLKELSTRFEEHGSSLEELSTRFEEHGSSLEELSTRFEEHGSSLEELSTRFEEHGSSLEKLSTRFEEHGSSIEELSTRFEEHGSSLEELSTRFKEHGSSLEELTKRNDETLKALTSDQESESEKLQKLEEKLSALENSWSETTVENGKLCQDVETKYEMVCQVVTDRLVSLERLRDIFNGKLDARAGHIKKLDNACLQIADFLPRISQVEQQTQPQAIGFSADLFLCGITCRHKKNLIFSNVKSNIGNHYDSKTGEFTAALDGLYAVYFSVDLVKDDYSSFTIIKKPCSCEDICSYCTCSTAGLPDGTTHASTFVLVEMKTSEKIFVKCWAERNSISLKNSQFVCFKIL